MNNSLEELKRLLPGADIHTLIAAFIKCVAEGKKKDAQKALRNYKEELLEKHLEDQGLIHAMMGGTPKNIQNKSYFQFGLAILLGFLKQESARRSLNPKEDPSERLQLGNEIDARQKQLERLHLSLQ